MKQNFEQSLKPFLLFLFLVVVVTEVAAKTEGISSKEFASQSIIGLPTNANDLNSKLLTPMIGGGKMQTANGSKFDASVLCTNSSNSFLEVFAQPSSTGDLSYLQFSRDTNLDGTIDNVALSKIKWVTPLKYTVNFTLKQMVKNARYIHPSAKYRISMVY